MYFLMNSIFLYCRELDQDRIDVIEVLASTDIPEPSSSPKLRHRINNWLSSNQTREANVSNENPQPPSFFPNFKINNQSHNPEVTLNWYKYVSVLAGLMMWFVPARMYFHKDFQPFVESYFNMRIHVIVKHVIWLVLYYFTNQSLRSFVWEMYSEPFHN